MPDSIQPQLDYQRRPRIGWRLRWFLGGLLLALSFVGFYFRQEIFTFSGDHWHYLSVYFAQRQCLKFSPPANQLIYSDDSADLKAPQGNIGVYTIDNEVFDYDQFGPRERGRGIGWTPLALTSFLLSWSNAGFSGDQVDPNMDDRRLVRSTPFLHELTSPSGNRRLVAISAYGGFDLVPSTWKTGTFWQPGSCVIKNGFGSPSLHNILRLDRGTFNDHVRLFAGAVDPNDNSRFSIPAQYNGRPFIIHGQLLDDESIEWKMDSGWFEREMSGASVWLAGSGNSRLADTGAVVPQRLEVIAPNFTWHPPKFVAFCDHDKDANVVFDDCILRVAVDTGKIVARMTWEDGFEPILASEDGRLLLLAEAETKEARDWKLINTETEEVILRQTQPRGVKKEVYAISPHADILAVAYEIGAKTLVERWALPSQDHLPDIHLATARGLSALACWDDGRTWVAQQAGFTDDFPAPGNETLNVYARNGTTFGPPTGIKGFIYPDLDWSLSYFQLSRDGSAVLAYWEDGRTGFQVMDKDSCSLEFLGHEGFYKNTAPDGFFALGNHVLACAAPNPGDSPLLFLQDLPTGKTIYRIRTSDFPTAMALSEADDCLLTCGEKPQLNFWPVPMDIRTNPAKKARSGSN